jgi:thiamine biosynthesis lipoprotein
MAELREVDAVFSTYRPDSFVSRLGRGEIALEACPPEMAEVLALGELAERQSRGAFRAHRTLDPDAPPWRIGIEDPHHTDRIVAVAPVHTGAVATSGTAHRGDHLVDARTGRPPAGVASVTVVAASLTWADIDATAAYAHGRDAARWLRTRPGRSGLVVWSDGSTTLVDGPGTRPGVTGGP